MSKERRSHKFINRWTQIRIATEVVLHSVLLLALTFWIFFAPPFVTAFSHYSIMDHQAVMKDLVLLNVSKWPLFLLLPLFVGLVSVLFSHHIAGPAFQLNKVINALRERDLNVSVKFRKWDYLGELEESLNRAVGRLREDMETITSEHNKALSLFHEIKGQIGQPEKAAELENHLASVSAVTKSYRV